MLQSQAPFRNAIISNNTININVSRPGSNRFMAQLWSVDWRLGTSSIAAVDPSNTKHHVCVSVVTAPTMWACMYIYIHGYTPQIYVLMPGKLFLTCC